MIESDEPAQSVKPGKPGPVVTFIRGQMKARLARKTNIRPAMAKPAKAKPTKTVVPSPPAPGCDAWWNR